MHWVILLGLVSEPGAAYAFPHYGKGHFRALPMRRGSACHQPTIHKPACPIADNFFPTGHIVGQGQGKGRVGGASGRKGPEDGKGESAREGGRKGDRTGWPLGKSERGMWMTAARWTIAEQAQGGQGQDHKNQVSSNSEGGDYRTRGGNKGGSTMIARSGAARTQRKRRDQQ